VVAAGRSQIAALTAIIRTIDPSVIATIALAPETQLASVEALFSRKNLLAHVASRPCRALLTVLTRARSSIHPATMEAVGGVEQAG